MNSNKLNSKLHKKQGWISITECPLCGSNDSNHLIDISKKAYLFGKECILVPGNKIPIKECQECGLAYKSIIPSKDFLSEVYERQVENIWTNPYNFRPELKFINQLFPKSGFDLLDIGASRGDLLKECSVFNGRRSALDIVEYPEIKKHIRGEIILSLLDDKKIKWQKKPYNLVTIFDVLEHLYDPKQAFRNIVEFTNRHGYILIETGDINSYKHSKKGMLFWPYTALFEHHIFWSKKSIDYISKIYNLEIVEWKKKKHKKVYTHPLSLKIKRRIKFYTYQISPKTYSSLLKRISPEVMGEAPGNPSSRDHFRVLLKKK